MARENSLKTAQSGGWGGPGTGRTSPAVLLPSKYTSQETAATPVPQSSSGASGGKWPKGFAPGPSAHLPTVLTPWPVKAAWGGCGTNKNPISYFVNMTNY